MQLLLLLVCLESIVQNNMGCDTIDVPELQVGGNVNSEASRVPKNAEDAEIEKLDGQQLQVYNYALTNEAIATKEAKALLGLQYKQIIACI